MDKNASKPFPEERIREKVADYRRSADAARRKANEMSLPQVRESYLRMAAGFDKLASDLEQALKLQDRRSRMQTQPRDDESEAERARAEQAAHPKT